MASGSEEYELVNRQITDNVLIIMTKAHPNTTKTYPIMIESNNIQPKAHNMIKHTNHNIA